MAKLPATFSINVHGSSGNLNQPNPRNGVWYSDSTIARFTLDGTTQQRVPPQVAAIGSWQLDASDNSPFQTTSLDWAWGCYKVEFLSDLNLLTSPPGFFSSNTPAAPEPIARYIYMFNVLVALEWTPTVEELTQLKWTFRRASDFLFDVTNGAMIFGQVVFGDASRLAGADIQILASTRLHPRSWVAGLYFTGDDAQHTRYKFMPIRVGRGAWDKETSSVIPWNEPEGYRILAHEWAHYALGLRDGYLEGSGDMMLPTFNIASNCIMDQLTGASELVLQPNSMNSFAGLQHTFTRLDDAVVLQDNVGPEILPFPLPLFHTSFKPDPKPVECTVESLGLSDLNNCWLYVIRGDFKAPRQIIAQGSFDDRSLRGRKPFTLLGAENGDYVVALCDYGSAHTATIKIGSIVNDALVWNAATVESANPLLAVIPVGTVDYTQPVLPTYSVRVNIQTDAAPTNVFVAALGSTLVAKLGANQQANGLPSLDGCVMCVWGDNAIPSKLAFAHYSEGGAPPSHNPGAPIPMSAGSSEGNVMIFFNPAAQAREQELAGTRVVTTTMYVSPAQFAGVANATPRSYVFALASNAPLPVDDGAATNLMPSLVMNHDNKLMADWYKAGGKKQLKIYRYNAGHVTATNSQHFLDRAYAAVGLNPQTAAGLFASTPTPEFYRLYLED